MGDVATSRLMQERKDFNKDKPFGFWAKPRRRPDGSTDMFTWECGIPAVKESSAYHLKDGNTYRIILKFGADFPARAPLATFSPPIFHTNVFPDGNVCLSLLLEAGHHGGTVKS